MVPLRASSTSLALSRINASDMVTRTASTKRSMTRSFTPLFPQSPATTVVRVRGMIWTPSLLFCQPRPVPKVALETSTRSGSRSRQPRSPLFLSPRTTEKMWLQHRPLRENSRKLGGKKRQLLCNNTNDDHPSARGSIRHVRKPDDTALTPTNLLASVRDDRILHRDAPMPIPLPRPPLPQLHAGRQQTPDVHDRKPRPGPM